MNRPPPRYSQSGFTLLEAIVAMVIMAAALMALYAWLSSSTLAVTRAQAQTRALEDARSALALVETINPMREPDGKRELGEVTVSWHSTPVVPRRIGRTRAGMPSLFDVTLYQMEVTIERAGEPAHGFSLRRAGWEAVRSLGNEDL